MLTGTNNSSGKGNAAANMLTGNSGNNMLTGLAGNDSLYGGAGNDSLVGGAGNDALYGGPGTDTFVFDTVLNAATNVDTIYGFDANADKIKLLKGFFAGLTPGTPMAAAAFKTSDVVIDASDRIIFNKTNGNLYYDADGSGAAASQVLFATIDIATLVGGVGNVTNADFFVTLV